MLDNDRMTYAADGTPLAYHLHRPEAAGPPPALVLTNGLVTGNYYWNEYYPRWAKQYTVVAWDLKGHGRSGPARSEDGATIPALADDLERVMDAAGVEKATLIAFSLGCQVILEAYRRMPDRIDALIPVLGPFERVFDTAFQVGGRGLGKAVYQALRRSPPRLLRTAVRGAALGMRLPGTFPVARTLGFIGKRVRDEQMGWFRDHFGGVDAVTAARIGTSAQHHSAADLLPRIDVPVLIVSGGKDVFAPPDRVGVVMAERIPNSEHLHLPDGTHTGLFEYPDEIGDAIDRFLATRVYAGG